MRKESINQNTDISMQEYDKIKVVIADDEQIFLMSLSEMLESQGFMVVGKGSDGFECIELCKTEHPDVVLLDIKMPILDGISAAQYIYEEGLAETIIIISAYEEKEFVEKAANIGVAGYLVKPINEKSLTPCINVAIAHSKKLRLLQEKIDKAQQSLDNRKIIERAKGRIMVENKLTEQEAFDYIRSISKGKNISMQKVAEMLLEREKF